MRKKMMTILFVLVLAMSCAFGCSKKTPDKPSGDISDIPAPDDGDSGDITNPPVITGDNFNLIALQYYSVNGATATVKTATVMLLENTEITPSLILSTVIDSLEDESIVVSANDATMSDGKCIVDFTESIAAVANQNANLEDAILDAVAQSILDNVQGCKSVSYRINGGAYDTVNNSFGLDDIYMDD